jgi:hypothetical protein
LAVGVAVLVFAAYGLGKVFALCLSFSPFEATVISLIALMGTVGAAAKLLWSVFSSQLPGMWQRERCAICGDDHDVAEHDHDLDRDSSLNDGVREALYASGAVKPNAPCPCGSEVRYRKCCGDARLFRQARASSQSSRP